MNKTSESHLVRENIHKKEEKTTKNEKREEMDYLSFRS